MSRYKFKEPTPRRRRPARQPPVPVPVGSVTGEPSDVDNWNYYAGQLIGNAVVVSHSGDMDYLYKMGFFGKASLSRFRPEYNHGFKGIGRKHHNVNSAQEMLRVTSRRKYMRHLYWKQLQEGGSSNSVMEDLEILPLPEPYIKTYKTPIIGSVKHKEEIKVTPQTQDDDSLDVDSTEPSEASWEVGKSVDPWVSGDPWAQTDYDPWAEDDPVASKQFWTTEDSGNLTSPKKDNASSSTEDEKNRAESEIKEVSASSAKDFSCEVMEMSEAKGQRPKKRSRQSRIINSDRSEATDLKNPEDKPCKIQKMESDNMMEDNGRVSQHSDTKQEDTAKEGHKQSLTFDARSLDEETGAQLLVVDDSDDGQDDWDVPERLPWRPVAKRDPYPLKEHLHLTLEEAFFLSFALGCLVVTDENELPMNLSQMWRSFVALRPLFPYKYAVYHNLRSKGWVPKQGFKYGVDYVVYKEGPAYFHSSYCVQIRVVDEENLEEIKELNDRQLTWSALAGLNRVTEQVAKEVMICYVLKPRSLTVEELQSPDSVKQLKIQETILQRWISSQERESNEQSGQTDIS